MGTIKRNETRAEKVMEKLESLLCTADNVKWCRCCRKCYDFLNVLYTEVYVNIYKCITYKYIYIYMYKYMYKYKSIYK